MMKHIRLLIAPVLAAGIAAALISTVANGAFWEWSKTSATNATADPSINWAEGMAPSAVNDSARAMMARAAEYRDDISGSVTTGGTSTAYTATSNQGLNATPTTGQLFAFTPHATNGVSATLRVDGGTIWPIQTAPGTAVPADTLVLGTPYSVKFNGTAWVLRSYYANPFNVPLGTVLDYIGATAPNSNFALAFGQCVSRTTYATLFSLVSTRYSVCDGTTTFGLPNLAGTITAGNDNMSGTPRGLITTAGSSCDGTVLGTQCGAQNVTVLQGNLPNVNFTVTDPGHVHITDASGTASYGAGSIQAARVQGAGLGNPTTNATTGITVASGGSGTALNKLPPIQIVNKIVRIF